MKLQLHHFAARILPALLLGPMFVFAPQTSAQAPAAAQVESEAADEEMTVERLAREDEQYEWIVDENTGREYRIDEIPRYEGGYKWMNDEKTRVRMPGGVSFEVLAHDEKKFRVKVWRAEWSDVQKTRQKRKQTEEERLAAQRENAKHYVVAERPVVDRLRLEEFGKGLPRVGQWRNGFDLADMNGDGNLDIVHGPARKSNPVPNIFLHDGAGNWTRWQARFPRNPYDYGDATTGDWNGDGHMDAAFGVHLRGMLAVVGDGEGGFTNYTKGIAIEVPGQGGDATTFSSRAIETIDWNGDGREDILALGEGPKGLKTHSPKGGRGEELINTARSLLLYENNGDGAWTPRTLIDTDDPLDAHFGDDFDFGDFNNDGEADLVIASRRRGAANILALSTGDGSLVDGMIGSMRTATSFATEVSDFDGDGRDDIALGYINSEVGVWRSVVDLYFARDEMTWERRPIYVAEGRSGVFSMQSGDLDGDGRTDLGILTGDGRLVLLLGGEDGSWVEEKVDELPPAARGCQGFELLFEDLDGDSRPEILAGFAGESTGIPSIPSLHNPGCKRNGSLRVWKVVASEG